MKLPSRRSLLIIAVLLLVAVNVGWRLSRTSQAARPALSGASLTATAESIAPTLSGLASMGREWQQHIDALPPEARAASAARFQEETKFFTQALTLPADERKRQMRARLEELMNDREIQAIMAEERIAKFARLDSPTRQKLLKSYVNYKSQVTSR